MSLAAARRGNGRPGPSATPQAQAVYRHAFLQALMQRAYMNEEDARALYMRITGLATDTEYLEFLSLINQDLGFAQFELRRVRYPGDRAWYVGFVNREADEDSRRAGRYRGKDGKPDVRITAFFRALLERIATHEEAVDGVGWITSGEALNILLAPTTAAPSPSNPSQPAPHAAPPAAAAPRLSKEERQEALATLTADGWLDFAAGRAGCYSLGVRSLLELGQLILELDLPPDTRDALELALT